MPQQLNADASSGTPPILDTPVADGGPLQNVRRSDRVRRTPARPDDDVSYATRLNHEAGTELSSNTTMSTWFDTYDVSYLTYVKAASVPTDIDNTSTQAPSVSVTQDDQDNSQSSAPVDGGEGNVDSFPNAAGNC